jgi:hypothetical protein
VEKPKMGRTAFLLRRDPPERPRGVGPLLEVCGGLLVTVACFNAHAAEAPATANDSPSASPAKPLDLRAPDITKILSPEQLQQLIANLRDENAEVDEVQVERPNQLPPPKPAWTGLMAPFWALSHPTQAWRIFAPLPADQVNSKAR